MIDKIYFKTPTLKKYYNLVTNKSSNSFSLKLNEIKKGQQVEEISVILKFSSPIAQYRSPQYTWEKIKKREISINYHSPKIIVLDDGTHVISSRNIGAWVIKDSYTIEWLLRSPTLTPFFQYNKTGGRVFNTLFNTENFDLELLFTKGEVPEFSRSKIPFKPIICFTDHCDFDDNDKLNKQLHFFKENGVTVSKGFFLNHFSKRKENSSYERDSELIKRFDQNGHELFYHALSQSLREKQDSIQEFKDFTPPPELTVRTYVDHGYQVYNFTKRQETGLTDSQWANIMERKGIQNLWTYLDSGTAMNGIINQLNPSHFSLGRVIKFNGFNLKLITRTQLFFCGREDMLLKYRKIAQLAKQVISKKTTKKIVTLLINISYVINFMIRSIIFDRKKAFKYATHSPFVFEAIIEGKTFHLFQTVEVTNFEDTFSPRNIDLLIKESGAIIAHCYFASPLAHQKGKLFQEGEISPKNQSNFKYLKEKIESNDVWNPTISELINFSKEITDLKFYWDNEKQKIQVNNLNVPIRYIQYV
ncbi:hypothetical protein [Flavivirga eckloniae]|uniref:NodB homology domain-containing protein n=1 Tax=Flavivirga eckloniae TaxID=1803846 RepID=A0A2K9PR80_9FLAO|nr:hypothetical protein [Flavivirga eckloniae]AUP79546.1 hypothetical protein C1H87_12840 [Flavivirga eckloniae]